MKYRTNIIENLKKEPFFTKKAFSGLAKEFSVSDATINSYLSRSVANKEIILLKNGVYITTDFYEKNKDKTSYLFYLANILRTPSYISSWTALQYYGLTTEAINTITCVSEKITRDYETKIGTFSYHSINKKLFKDFVLKKEDFEYYIATPAKALFDLLYFKTNQFRGVSFEQIDLLIESLRIDIEEMAEEDKNAFYAMVKEYLK